MKTTLFVIIALLMLNVYSKEKKDYSYLYRTAFKVDKVSVNIPLPGPGYHCVQESITKKANTMRTKNPDSLVAQYTPPPYSYVPGQYILEATSPTFVKVLKADEKKDCSLEDFKQLSAEAIKGKKLIQPWQVDDILYSQEKKKDIKDGKIVDIGLYLSEDTGFGSITVTPNEQHLPPEHGFEGLDLMSAHYTYTVTCESAVLVKGKVLYLVAQCKFGGASGIKHLMEVSRKWADATIKANK